MKQNRLFLLIVVSLFFVLSLVTYFGGMQIYESEKKWRYDNVNTELQSAAERIKGFSAHSEHDLSFLQSFQDFRWYLDSNFKSVELKDEVIRIFSAFMHNERHYHRLGVIDFSGQEIIRVENDIKGNPEVVTESNLQNERDSAYFQEAMKLAQGQIYISYIYPGTQPVKTAFPSAPIIRLAAPAFNSKGDKSGVFFLDLHMSRILEYLSEDMFLQTREGSRLSLKSDGSIDISKSSFDFKDSEGEIELSPVQEIHYSTFEFVSGEKLTIAAYHDHTSLQEGAHRLIAVSVGILLLSFGLLFSVSYLNFARYKRLIDSHRAIIASLAGLTEWRDPNTGEHLERTRDYAVLLAKQLHNSKKYQKIITRGFIEDLYFAAPLHDMGKVGIRDSILLKEGKLTVGEYEEMKEHVRIGKRLLQDVIDKYGLKDSVLDMSRNICTYHHEKYNGKGYSEGLKGEEIPLEARLFALADAYDAIRSKRPYKSELPHEEAVSRISSDRGEHFDPDVVDAFLKCEGEFKKMTVSKASPEYHP